MPIRVFHFFPCRLHCFLSWQIIRLYSLTLLLRWKILLIRHYCPTLLAQQIILTLFIPHLCISMADSICGVRGGYETPEVRDVRRNDGGCGLCGGPGTSVDGVFPGRLQSFRHQRPPVDNCSPGRGGMTERRNKGRNISWRNGSLQRKPGLGYGMQSYARTWWEGPRKG